MSVALVAIVKNERHVLPRLFESVRDICDLAIISDTGSTDGTQEWLKQEAPIPVELWEEPWENMEHNRSLVMEHAHNKADWLLLMDADMTAEGTLPETLDPIVDAWQLELPSGDMTFWVSRLVSGRVPWCYQGYGHEFLAPLGNERVPRGQRKLEGLKVIHHADGGNRGEKYDRSTTALMQDLVEHPERRARTLFYIANNLRDMGRTEEAIDYYKRRMAEGGWVEEQYVSLINLGKLTQDADYFWQAYKLRPSRREALAYLGRMAVTVPPSDDILFVDNRLVSSEAAMPWNRQGYGTYLPCLVKALGMSPCAVLEIGAGDWSTPFLHQVCYDRELVTVESNANWRARYASFESPRHRFVENLAAIPTDVHWGVVLVDGTFTNRVEALDLAADVFVVHDTQPAVIGDYPGVAEALDAFKYRQDFTDLMPHTTIVSNVREIP